LTLRHYKARQEWNRRYYRKFLHFRLLSRLDCICSADVGWYQPAELFLVANEFAKKDTVENAR
jgi:hypothetical protein